MTTSRFPTMLRTGFLAPFVIVGLAACGSAQEAVSEQLVEQAAGGDVDIELDDDGQVASIETEDGSLTAVTGGDVPEEWPADVPLFDGGVLGSSQVVTSDGQTVVSLSYTTDADPAETFESLVAAYGAAGFTATAESTMGDSSGGISSYVGERGEVTVSMGVLSGEETPTGVNLGLVFPAG
jgi:hypothetical protein